MYNEYQNENEQYQTYINEHLMLDLPSGGKLSGAAIFGDTGWARSHDFPEVSEEWITEILEGLEDPSRLVASGISLGGIRYFLLPSEGGVVLRGRHGTNGIIVGKTNTAMVVGVYADPVAGNEAEIRIKGMRDLFLEWGG